MQTKKSYSKDEFEFYYLIELTKQKIKPLSRWEKPVSNHQRNILKRHGLFVEVVPRKTLIGRRVYETVFSTSSRYTNYYSKKFANAYFSKAHTEQKLEGILFGYPSCCVKQFIEHPYSKNNLIRGDQSILFHWACNNCRITPELLPYYRSVYNQVSEELKGGITIDNNDVIFSKRRKIIQSTAAALLLSAGIVSAQSITDSTHYIPVEGDDDLNGLTYAEEIYLGNYYYGSGTCDTFAKFYKTVIDSLPTYECDDEVYLLHYKLRGIVTCPKCGLNLNMGYVTIVNPMQNLEMDISYLGLHFMENGFFSYESSIDTGRIDIDKLKKILFSFDQEHMLSVEGDTDGDGLTDVEEDSLWLDHSDNDTDNNGIPDGAQLAQELIRIFPKLEEESDNIHSYIKFMPVWGIENCEVCGSSHNMGYVEITNPENENTVQIPYLALHSLAHGSFSYNGTVHQNERVDPIELLRTIKTHTVFIDNDTDSDGLNDSEEEYFGLDINKIDTDNNGICDTKELALKFVNDIKALPTEPRTDGPYIEYIDMDGIHLCSVCGEDVVMGIMNIYNPLVNTIQPFEISYYAFHFMEKGSFEHEGLPDYWGDSNRIDPVELSNYLYSTVTNVKQDENEQIPKQFALLQNYPNPFNPGTTIIRFDLPHESKVNLQVFNLLGEKIAEILHNKIKSAGQHSVTWNTGLSGTLPSGIYLLRADIKSLKNNESYSFVRKMILLK
ncbi:MAG: T9SS type A sorting domain-containing protein [Ignavibacteria bacterium]|jgi:hypothetical protein